MEGEEEGSKGEEKGGFKRSNKTSRSSVEKRSGEDLGKIMRELEQEMREGLRGVKEEIREMAREQREALREEIEKMKEDLRDREERWNREKENIQERIRRMEKEIKGLKIEERVRENECVDRGGFDIGRKKGEMEDKAVGDKGGGKGKNENRARRVMVRGKVVGMG